MGKNLLTTWLSGLLQRETISGSAEKGKLKVVTGDYRENVVPVGSADAAMKIASVYRAVHLIAEGIAVMPLSIKRFNAAKGVYQPFRMGRAAERNGVMLDYLINCKPNDRISGYDLKYLTVVQILLHGNSLWVPKYDGQGEMCEIACIEPGSWSYNALTQEYIVNDMWQGVFGTYQPHQVYHFKNLHESSVGLGISTIAWARQTMETVATADKETQKRFATGGRFKAFLTNDTSVRGFGEYEDEQMQALSEKVNSSINAGTDITYIPGDAKIQPFSMSSADLEFLSSRVFGVREIARFFGVPLSKLMEPTNANYKSVEMEQMDFYAEALQPMATKIAAEILAKEVTPETYRWLKVEWNKDPLFEMDRTGQIAWNKGRLETGQSTVNELRKESDKEPVKGGDEVYLSCNVAALGSDKLAGGAPGSEGSEGGSGGDSTGGGEEGTGNTNA